MTPCSVPRSRRHETFWQPTHVISCSTRYTWHLAAQDTRPSDTLPTTYHAAEDTHDTMQQSTHHFLTPYTHLQTAGGYSWCEKIDMMREDTHDSTLHTILICAAELMCVAVYCSVLQYVVVCCTRCSWCADSYVYVILHKTSETLPTWYHAAEDTHDTMQQSTHDFLTSYTHLPHTQYTIDFSNTLHT